jgi:cytochrome c oxidase subunit 1
LFWSFIFIIVGLFSEFGGGSGWTLYPPLSTSVSSVANVTITCLFYGLLITGVSSSMASLNFFSSIQNLRVFGMSMVCCLMYVWCVDIVSILLLGVVAVLGIVLLMLVLDLYFNTVFFDPMFGGDVLLFQHLFWFFGHPEVYVLILPSFGGVTLYLVCCGLSICFGNGVMILTVFCIGLLGCIVWAHHMYICSLSVDVKGYFSIVTMCIGFPTGNKVLNWLCTLYCFKCVFVGLYVVSVCNCLLCIFVIIFVVGGCFGILVSNSVIDVECHDGYLIIGHFHIVLSIGVVISIVVGLVLVCILGMCLVDMFYMFVGIVCTFVINNFIGWSCFTRRLVDIVYCVWCFNNSVGSVLTNGCFVVLGFIF